MMTDDEAAEHKLLALASEQGKFGIEVGALLTEGGSAALERLQMRDWIRLIDISPIAHAQGLFRIFRIMPEGLAWLRKTSH